MDPRHFQEWIDSCVDSNIITANVRSVHGEQAAEHMFPGGLGDATGTFITASQGRKVGTLLDGGWWVSGLDPLNNWERMDWGQLKPDTPRCVKGKTFKYESPHGQSTRAIFLDVPNQPDFWASVEADTTRTLYIAEGAKKSGCLLSQNYAAVAVPGVRNVAKKNEWGELRAIPELKPFLTPGRPVVFIYDSEEAPRKQRIVYKALKASGKVLQDEGCEVGWVAWDPQLGKGIDDVCANHGVDAVKRILGKVFKLRTYQEQLYRVVRSVDDHVCRNLFEHGKGDWCVIGQSFYRYTGEGYWQHISDEQIQRTIATYLEECYIEKQARKKDDPPIRQYKVATSANVKASFSYARARLAQEQSIDTAYLRCFRNGTLDMRDGNFRDPRKKDYLTSLIDADYTPDQACPDIFKTFIETSFGQENLDLIRAVTSMLVDPTAPWGFFPYLLGKSGGGKGTLISLWQSLFDEANVGSGTSLSILNNEDKRHQLLKSKSLYCVPDVTTKYLKGLAAFYELVENGKLEGRALFSSISYTQRFFTRFVVASVKPLAVEGSSEGWDRRAIVIPVNPLPFVERDHQLREKLEAVKGSIISWAISMDPMKRNYLLKHSTESSESVRAACREMQLTGDPVAEFADYCLRPSIGGEGLTLLDLHERFEQFAKATGRVSMGSRILWNRIKELLPHAYEPRRKYRTSDPGYEKNTFRPAMIRVSVLPGAFQQTPIAGTGGQDTMLTIDKSRLVEGGLDELEQDRQQWLDQHREALSRSMMSTADVTQAEPATEMPSAKAPVLEPPTPETPTPETTESTAVPAKAPAAPSSQANYSQSTRPQPALPDNDLQEITSWDEVEGDPPPPELERLAKAYRGFDPTRKTPK